MLLRAGHIYCTFTERGVVYIYIYFILYEF